MILAVDIGNTHIVSAIVSSEGKVIGDFRVESDINITEDHYYSIMKSYLDFFNLELVDINGIVVSSVVPRLNTTFKYFSNKYLKVDPLYIDLNLKLPFTFAPNMNSDGLGADRIVDIVGAMQSFPHESFVVFDFGTAATYDIIQNGVYVGGGIFLGADTSIKALFGNTAKCPKVDFHIPDSVFGANTIHQIQAGMFIGYIGQVEYIIEKIKERLPEVKIIFTGGLAKELIPHMSNQIIYDKDLPIIGMLEFYNKECKVLGDK